jgi:hypothetical protein
LRIRAYPPANAPGLQRLAAWGGVCVWMAIFRDSEEDMMGLGSMAPKE